MIGQLGMSKVFQNEQNQTKESAVEELSKEDKQKYAEEFFTNLADFLLKANKTILDIVKPKVYDKVLNAREYQLLKYKHLYKQLEASGFQVPLNYRQGVEHHIIPFGHEVKTEFSSRRKEGQIYSVHSRSFSLLTHF